MEKRSSNQQSFDNTSLSNMYIFIKKQCKVFRIFTPAKEQEQERLFFALFTAEQKNI